MHEEVVEHLGDGAYVAYNGYGLELRANHHIHPTDKVWLEPEAVERLIKFWKEQHYVDD